MSAKTLLLSLCKSLGIFQITNHLYRRKLNILCFHGFSYDDEHQFRPSLFMRVGTLRKRLSWLHSNNFTILTLDEGMQCLANNRFPSKKCAVITIDDGFRSVLDLAAPELHRSGFPATLYITSYYSKKETPIFRLAMQYIAWKSEHPENRLKALLQAIPETQNTPQRQNRSLLWQLIEYGEQHLEEDERTSLARQTAELLEVDYCNIESSGKMSLVSSTDIPALEGLGIDVQLHTHRHRFPEQPEAARAELVENQQYLEPLTGRKLRHFCYPSGIWSKSQWQVLEDLKIQSATTCDPGMNCSTTHRFGLMRFLDRDDLPDIEFEAEMMGFKQMIRDVKKCFSRNRINKN